MAVVAFLRKFILSYYDGKCETCKLICLSCESFDCTIECMCVVYLMDIIAVWLIDIVFSFPAGLWYVLYVLYVLYVSHKLISSCTILTFL
jgi:hypothetical protein